MAGVFQMRANNGAAVMPVGPAMPAGVDAATAAEQARQQARALEQVINGRYTAPLLLDSTNLTALAADSSVQTEYLVPNPLILEKPHERLTVIIKFRLNVTVAPYDSVFPEAFQNFLRRVKMWGTANGTFGQQTMWDMSGATLYGMSKSMPGSSAQCYIEVNGVRVADPSVPFGSPFSGAVGSYDIKLVFQLPTAPMTTRGIASMMQLRRYTLSPLDWGNTVRVQYNLGTKGSFGVPNAATVVTFTGFESATGSPSVTSFQNFAMLGRNGNEKARTNGLVTRVENAINNITSVGTNLRLGNLLDQKITTGFLVKSGRQTTSGGITSFSTLSNAMLDNTKVYHGQTTVRDNKSQESYRAYYADMPGRPVVPQGYFTILFDEIGNLKNAYRADALEGGANFFLASDVLTSFSDQVFSVVQEEISQSPLGGPFGPVQVV